VRSYSQTTGVWMRGILENDYGVELSGVQWVTFEDGQVGEAVHAAGVIPDPEAAACSWYGKHDLVPVNHMVVVTDELVRSNPKAVTELYRLLEEGRKAAPPPGVIDTAPFGKEVNRRCLELLMSYCQQQKLISRRLNFNKLW